MKKTRRLTLAAVAVFTLTVSGNLLPIGQAQASLHISERGASAVERNTGETIELAKRTYRFSPHGYSSGHCSKKGKGAQRKHC